MEAVLELRKKNGPLEVAGGELGKGVPRAASGEPGLEASWELRGAWPRTPVSELEPQGSLSALRRGLTTCRLSGGA